MQQKLISEHMAVTLWIDDQQSRSSKLYVLDTVTVDHPTRAKVAEWHNINMFYFLVFYDYLSFQESPEHTSMTMQLLCI